MSQESEMQRRFGARINVTPARAADQQMVLIAGSPQTSLLGLVRAREGRALLAGPTWVLAEMSLMRAMGLLNVPGVRLVAGVSVDPARIESLRNLFERNTGA